MAKNIKCTVSYDGTNFSGFQVQPNKRTIQVEIESALKKIHKGAYTRIYPSGRTDAGVHAIGQVFHFKTSLHIPKKNWKKALNTLVPEDIYITGVEEVALDFHSQYDAVEKEYRYIVLNTKERDVFQRNYTYYYPYNLQLDQIEKACQLLKGTHDFSQFCSARTAVKGSKVRTLYDVRVEKQRDELTFILRGNGFLYNMVRMIVGLLLEIGSERQTLEYLQTLLEQKSNEKAGPTAPASGLYLWEVIYE